MTPNSLFRQFLLVGLSCLSCVASAKGVKKMETACWPVKPVEIGFDEGIRAIFPVPMEYSFGMVAGKEDQETLRLATIKGQHLHENVFPRNPLEPYDDIGFCIGDCSTMYLSNRRILSVVDWKSKKLIYEYLGVGQILQNTYRKTKLIDAKNKLVLTVFTPFYNDSLTKIINNTSSLTLENLVNKKRIKSIPISTESDGYITEKRSNVGVRPTVAFGPNNVIYRESNGFKWLCVNNSLEYIEHPLKDTLNVYNEYFGTDLISLEISPTEPYAVAICQKSLGTNHFPAIIQWNKAPAVMPVPVSLEKDQDIEYSSLQLSPSGRWAYFYTTGYSGAKHFLLYIDTALPGGCLPPFDLKVASEDHKATWITTPEGFVMKVEGKLLYWDLSKFNGNVFLNKQEHDYLQLEKNP